MISIVDFTGEDRWRDIREGKAIKFGQYSEKRGRKAGGRHKYSIILAFVIDCSRHWLDVILGKETSLARPSSFALFTLSFLFLFFFFVKKTVSVAEKNPQESWAFWALQRQPRTTACIAALHGFKCSLESLLILLSRKPPPSPLRRTKDRANNDFQLISLFLGIALSRLLRVLTAWDKLSCRTFENVVALFKDRTSGIVSRTLKISEVSGTISEITNGGKRARVDEKPIKITQGEILRLGIYISSGY